MTTLDRDLVLVNGGCAPLADVPEYAPDRFRAVVAEAVFAGDRLAAFLAYRDDDALRLVAVLARRAAAQLSLCAMRLTDRRYPALTPECPQAHLFEREIAEQWGVEPVGHPWLKPVRYSRPVARHGDPAASDTPLSRAACGHADYFRIEGDEIHEVAVGPVHAGVIEPGHFRFQCHGETVHHLEIMLGYQHRGVEDALVGGPDRQTRHYMETLAGDTTIGHVTAYCRIVEALERRQVPARAHALRGVALELERIANHVGDLGALAGDIGFLPTFSYCGRIRGDVLNLTAALCGNRFGRGLVRPGGVAATLDTAAVARLHARLTDALRDADDAVSLLWTTPSVLARFEGTGALPAELATRIGLVGVAARACGLDLDVRADFPYGIYQLAHIPVATWHSGDVFARAFVRWLEVQRSAAFVLEQLNTLPVDRMGAPPSATCSRPPAALPPRHVAVALVEAWRGELCHVAVTDADGRFARYKVVDPSFHNWFGLGLALRNQQISDFPLCNKSFNLSYCGHDL